MASAQDRMICFARFCQTRLNYEFILHKEKSTPTSSRPQTPFQSQTIQA